MEYFLPLKKSLDPRLREDDEKSCIAISVGHEWFQKFFAKYILFTLETLVKIC